MEKEREAHSAKPAAHKIGWLNLTGYKGETWNPVVGCRKVSEGCKNCYAERMGNRLAGIANKKSIVSTSLLKYSDVIYNGKWNGKASFNPDELTLPLKWKSPRVVFVCSMGDLFFEEVKEEWINLVFDTIEKCPQHIFIILTKRPELLKKYALHQYYSGFPDNVWIGVTAENQETANERIPYLNCIAAAVKFVSVEPMLSAIDFNESIGDTLKWHAGGLKNCLSWVICGGESGPGARPMHPDWVRSLRDQCQRAGVPFFFKQWGEWRPGCEYGEHMVCLNPRTKKDHLFPDLQSTYKVGRKEAGNLLDGRKWEEYPEIN